MNKQLTPAVSADDRMTDGMIAVVNQNHREARYRNAIDAGNHQLDKLRRRSIRSSHYAKVMLRHNKLTSALVLAILARCAVGAVELGMLPAALGLPLGAIGMIGSVWIAGGLWQEFTKERRDCNE